MVVEKDVNYSYDCDEDVVFIQVKDKYQFKESIRLDVGVYLDIDVNYNPVCFEIIDASKRMGINKELLINPKLKVHISVKNGLIEVTTVLNQNNIFNKNVVNNFNIPDVETELAII